MQIEETRIAGAIGKRMVALMEIFAKQNGFSLILDASAAKDPLAGSGDSGCRGRHRETDRAVRQNVLAVKTFTNPIECHAT